MEKPVNHPVGETDKPRLELNPWQDVEIEKALREADAGDFATAEQAAAVIQKYVNGAAAVAPLITRLGV